MRRDVYIGFLGAQGVIAGALLAFAVLNHRPILDGPLLPVPVDPALGAVVPPAPLDHQKLAPCLPGEHAINGGCWLKVDPGPGGCPVRFYSHAGGCYVPLRADPAVPVGRAR